MFCIFAPMYLLPLSTGFVFPDDAIPETKKADPKWGSQVARAIYSRFCLGGSYGWGYNDVAGLRMIRDYGDGVQSESIYRQWYTNGSPVGGGNPNQIAGQATGGRHAKLMNTQMRVAMANISYKVFSPVPKFSNTIISTLAENDYRVECSSVEQSAIDDKTKQKLSVFYAAKLMNPLANQLGIPPIPIPFEPRDERDLDMMEKRGLFKTDIERAIEKVVETGFALSNWSSDVRRKNNKDAIDFNFRCAKIYVEEETGAVKVRYVDTTKLIVLWNDNNQEPIAIGDLRLVQIQYIYKDLKKAGYSDEEIKGIANTYRGQQVEQWTNDSSIFERKDPVTGKWTWLDFMVPVLDFEYLSTDYIQYASGKDKKGRKFYKKNEEFVPDEKKSKDREYDEYKCNYWYEGSYIVGTDKVFNWRKKPNQMHKDKLNPVSSYVFDKAVDNGQSLTQRVIGLCDDLMFAMLKKRAAVWAAAPKGYDIDIGEGGNMRIGGQEYSVFDLIHMHRQNGVKFRQTKMSPLNGKITTSPISEMENGLGPQGQEWLAEIAACVYQIAETMGITQAMAAAPTTDTEKAVGVFEGEITATNHAIYPIKESDREFKRKVAEKLALQTRIEIKYNEKARKFYENQLGSHIIGVLDAIDHISLEGLGITMKALPTRKQKEAILMRAMEMSKIATRDGSTYLTPADVEYVAELLEQDDIEAARYFMNKQVDLNRERAEVNAKESQMLTGQIQMQSAQAAEQFKQQTIQMELQAKMALIEAEKQKEIAVLQAKYQYETGKEVTTINVKADREDQQIDKEIAGELLTGDNIRNNRKL